MLRWYVVRKQTNLGDVVNLGNRTRLHLEIEAELHLEGLSNRPARGRSASFVAYGNLRGGGLAREGHCRGRWRCRLQ